MKTKQGKDNIKAHVSEHRDTSKENIRQREKEKVRNGDLSRTQRSTTAPILFTKTRRTRKVAIPLLNYIDYQGLLIYLWN